MKLIGLTGNFCTGKSTISGFFKELGAYVIDADKITHGLYATDPSIRCAIEEIFGRTVFTGGKIDRNKLRKKAFKHPEHLKRLCGITHPKILNRIKGRIRNTKKKYVVVEAALIIETGLVDFFDYLIVVKSTLKKQIERCSKRGFSERDIQDRIEYQMPQKQKLRKADYVINNSYSKRYAKNETIRVWNKIKRNKKSGRSSK